MLPGAVQSIIVIYHKFNKYLIIRNTRPDLHECMNAFVLVGMKSSVRTFSLVESTRGSWSYASNTYTGNLKMAVHCGD
jgi:hypothetical protein